MWTITRKTVTAPRSHLVWRVSAPSLRSPPPSPLNPWLTYFICEQRSSLRAAEINWHKSRSPSALAEYQDPLGSFSHSVSRSKTGKQHHRHQEALFCVEITPLSISNYTSLTANDFANFSTNNVTAISSHFSPKDESITCTRSHH